MNFKKKIVAIYFAGIVIFWLFYIVLGQFDGQLTDTGAVLIWLGSIWAVVVPYWVLRRRGWQAEKNRQMLMRQREIERERQREKGIRDRYFQAYEARKQTIGKIVCPQCKWTGDWGTGMTYEEFFLYELTVKHGLTTGLCEHTSGNLNSEAQYKCPMCNSANWQKV